MELPNKRRLMGGAAFMTLLGLVGYFGQGHIHVGGGSSGYSHRTASKTRKSALATPESVSQATEAENNSPATNAPVAQPKKWHGKTSVKKSPPSGTIDLNHASAEQLQQIPGIGPSISSRIVEYRDSHGPFKSVDDLLDVKGIGDKLLAKIGPYLSL